MSRVVSVTIWASVDDGEVIRLGEGLFAQPVTAVQIIRDVLAGYDKHDPMRLAIDGPCGSVCNLVFNGGPPTTCFYMPNHDGDHKGRIPMVGTITWPRYEESA